MLGGKWLTAHCDMSPLTQLSFFLEHVIFMFGQDGRRYQLIRYIREEEVDIVGIQETIKQDFSIHELQGLSSHKFAWQWLLANGHSGGILLGVKKDTFEVDDMDRGEFFVSMSLTRRQ